MPAKGKGKKEFELIAKITVDEESKEAAKQEAADAVRAGAESVSVSGRDAKGGGARDTTPKAANVTANVKANTAGVAKDVQDAIDAGDKQLQINIDTLYLRKQMDAFFTQVFTAKVNIAGAGQGGQQFDQQHSSIITTGGAGQSRGTPPEDVVKAMTKGLRTSINDLYRNLDEAFHAAGKTRFGTQSIAPGNEMEKAIEIMDRFGGKFGDLLDIDKSSPIGRVNGGKLSAKELGEALGIDPNSPILHTVQEAARGLSATNAQGEISTRSVDILLHRLGEWAQTTPVTASPSAAAEPIAQAITQAMKQEGAGTPTSTPGSATPITDELARYARSQKQRLGQVPFQDFDLAFPQRDVAGTGSRSDDDPEATATANRQLLKNQRGGRGLIGRFQKRNINGIPVDVEDLLQDVRGETDNSFHGIFQTKETKTSPSRLIQLQPKTDEEIARARELGRSRRDVTIEGVGRATPLGPTEALRAAIVRRYDDEIADALFSDPSFKNLVRQSVEYGDRPKALVDPQTPREGQGGGARGGVISSSGHGFEGGYHAAIQLADVQDQLGQKYASLERAQGSGRPTDKIELAIARLEARESRLIEKAAPLVGATPEQARAMAAAASARGEENRARIANDEGLSQDELEKKKLKDPTLLGGRARELISSGALPDPERIIEAVNAKLSDPGYAESAGGGTRAVIAKAIGEVLEPLRAALPEKGPIKQEAERFLFPSIYRSMLGEKERVMRSNIDDSRGTTEERRGGFQQINSEAEDAVTRAEGGRGRGRVAKTVGSRLTGGQTSQGRPEAEPILDRPTTDVDLAIARVAADMSKALESEKQRTDEARRAAELEGEKRFPIPTHPAGPNAPVPGAPIRGVRSTEDQKAYEAFVARSTTSRLSRAVPASAVGSTELKGELDRLKDIRRQSSELLANPVQGPIFGVESTMDDQRQRMLMTGADAPQEVLQDAMQALERRAIAAAAPSKPGGDIGSPSTRATKDPQTGAEAAARFRKAGGVAAGESDTLPAAAKAREVKDKTPFAGFNAGGAMGSKPPAPPAEGGHGGFSDVTGPVHVIVDNVPLQVAFTGGAPSGSGVSSSQAAVGSRDDATKARADMRRFMSESNQKVVNDFIEARRGEGKSDAQIQKSLTQFDRRFGAVAALALGDSEGGGGGGATGQLRGRNARRDRLGLGPLVARDEGFFASVDKADAERATLASEARAAERGIPKRGFSASVTDIFSNLGGLLDKQVASVARFQREGQQLTSLQAKGPGIRANAETISQEFAAAKSIRDETQAKIESLKATKGNEKEVRALSKTLKSSTKDFNDLTRENEDAQRKLQEYNVEEREQRKRTDQAKAGLPGVGGRAAAFGIGFGAAAGAVAVGNLVATVAQQITGAIVEGVGPVLERMTGFTATTARVTSGAADTIRSRGGDEQAVAGIGAQTGISAAAFGRVSPAIVQRADIEAGNKALQEQLDLVHAAENLARAPGGAGISSTTGGFLGTPLFGIPSTQEMLVNELNAIPPEATDAQKQRRANADSQLSIDLDPQIRENLLDAASGFEESLAVGADRLRFFNDAAEKGGSKLKLLENATTTQTAAASAAAKEAGLFDLAQLIEDRGLGVTGQTGPLTGADLQSLLASVNRGATTPSPELVIQDTARARNAQIQLEDAIRQRSLTQINPQSQALALAQQGFGGSGPGTPSATDGIVFGKGDKDVQRDLNGQLKETQKLYNDINQEVDAGVAAAKDFVAANLPDASAQFNSSLNNVSKIAKQISGIEIGMETEHAAYAAAQFSYQIGITKRSLADAKGLVSGVGDNLGAVERQIFDLQRESKALGLAQSQRQINFSVAVAGFTAPGLTSEEREARINAAKQEAAYAQKQLDIQKKLFGLEGKQFNIGASRQVQDLQAQLGLLEKGREITLHDAAAQKKIKALTVSLAKESKTVETIYDSAVERSTDIMKLSADLAAATGKAMADVAEMAIDAFADFYKGMINVLDPTARTSPDSKGGGSNTNGDPRVGGGGGGDSSVDVDALSGSASWSDMVSPSAAPVSSPTYINVTGNKFSTEEEKADMIRKISKAVEDAQGRKGALLGLRPYGG